MTDVDEPTVRAESARKVLVTGGAGYIGSTVASALLDDGIEPIVLDDLSAGSADFVTGRTFYHGDIADGALIERIVAEHPEIDVVVHCAARIVVPESVADPLGYYTTNVAGTLALLNALRALRPVKLVFSGSASIYGPAGNFAVDEQSAVAPGSPYAQTKAMIERILADAAAGGQVQALSLRYFNPIGADPKLRSGMVSADPSHALGRLLTAERTGRPFTITGTDWPTRDGTGIRDYIHVWDLALAHVAAVRRFDQVIREAGPYVPINLGTGTGTTVRELVDAYRKVTGNPVAVAEAPPRPGDVAGSFTRVERANTLLGWTAERSVADGIRDSRRWASARFAG
jgi:UDP-glucose 4-epimerase